MYFTKKISKINAFYYNNYNNLLIKLFFINNINFKILINFFYKFKICLKNIRFREINLFNTI